MRLLPITTRFLLNKTFTDPRSGNFRILARRLFQAVSSCSQRVSHDCARPNLRVFARESSLTRVTVIRNYCRYNRADLTLRLTPSRLHPLPFSFVFAAVGSKDFASFRAGFIASLRQCILAVSEPRNDERPRAARMRAAQSSRN